MGTVQQHRPGTLSWAELATPDVGAAAQFYGQAFGWQAEDLATGGYMLMRLRGQRVCAITSPRESRSARWLTYFATDDADASVKAIVEHGGELIVEPADVPVLGRAAVCADPAGALFAVWQPGGYRGADIVGEAGALSWTQLVTNDMSAVTAFYAAVFGWQAMPTGGLHDYTLWLMDGDLVGGLRLREDDLANDERAGPAPHWEVSFAVADSDEWFARALSLGATALLHPVDGGPVRSAVTVDPVGASCAVSSPIASN